MFAHLVYRRTPFICGNIFGKYKQGNPVNYPRIIWSHRKIQLTPNPKGLLLNMISYFNFNLFLHEAMNCSRGIYPNILPMFKNLIYYYFLNLSLLYFMLEIFFFFLFWYKTKILPFHWHRLINLRWFTTIKDDWMCGWGSGVTENNAHLSV